MSPINTTLEPAYAAFVGIDWADRQHAWVLQSPGAPRVSGVLKQSAEDIELWAADLARKFYGQPVAIAVEQSRGALTYALCKYDHLVLYPVHPSTSHDFRKAMCPSGSKDDPKDAELLLDLLTRHRDHLRPLKPDSPATRKLLSLVEIRRGLVDQRTAAIQRITDKLKIYYRQVLGWFDRLDTPIVAAFLEQWPTVEQARKASENKLRKFFVAHHSRNPQKIEQRIDEIRNAKPAITDPAIVEPSVLLVQIELQVIAALREGIARLDAEIQTVFTAHPDSFIFSSFPGAGPALAPRLLAAFGTDRTRYTSASELQCQSGIAPVTEASGRKQIVHFRWKCPKFLRQTFHEYAAISVQFCDWARQFYDYQRNVLKNAHHAAVRALAYKWIRILYRCWKDCVPYDDSIYTNARRPPRATPSDSQPSGKPLKILLKTVDGFQRFAGIEA